MDTFTNLNSRYYSQDDLFQTYKIGSGSSF